MGDYGIKVMLPGKDITSSEPRDHVLSSKFSAVKIVNETLGTVVISSGGTAYGTVNHNLGFVPLTLLYTETTPNSWEMGFPFPSPAGIYPNSNPNFTNIGTAKSIVAFVNNALTTGTARYKIYTMGDSG